MSTTRLMILVTIMLTAKAVVVIKIVNIFIYILYTVDHKYNRSHDFTSMFTAQRAMVIKIVHITVSDEYNRSHDFTGMFTAQGAVGIKIVHITVSHEYSRSHDSTSTFTAQ